MSASRSPSPHTEHTVQSKVEGLSTAHNRSTSFSQTSPSSPPSCHSSPGSIATATITDTRTAATAGPSPIGTARDTTIQFGRRPLPHSGPVFTLEPGTIQSMFSRPVDPSVGPHNEVGGPDTPSVNWQRLAHNLTGHLVSELSGESLATAMVGDTSSVLVKPGESKISIKEKHRLAALANAYRLNDANALTAKRMASYEEVVTESSAKLIEVLGEVKGPEEQMRLLSMASGIAECLRPTEDRESTTLASVEAAYNNLLGTQRASHTRGPPGRLSDNDRRANT